MGLVGSWNSYSWTDVSHPIYFSRNHTNLKSHPNFFWLGATSPSSHYRYGGPRHPRPVQRRSSLFPFPIPHSVHRHPPVSSIAGCLAPTPSYLHASPPFLAVLFRFGIHSQDSLIVDLIPLVEPTASLPRYPRTTISFALPVLS
jgi:hypothetical protein